jgi:hypothetical protein
MQHLPLMSVMQRAVRSRICTRCNQRPAGSETWRPAVVRSCEQECPVFSNLARLSALAKRWHADDPSSLEQRIIESICINCHVTTSAGDFCDKRHTRSCALSRHGSDVLHVIDPVLRGRSRMAAEPRPMSKAR